ncbi:MAG: FAD-binding oxidoreductase [Dehalococcoidia bacterium]|nr:FAD-binding oxidoreductase [Dehalococcoidia bacterium]
MTRRSANVVVIGGGVNGTSIAMHLARLGAGKVILVERGHLAGGASGRSGAMVREHYLHPTLVKMAMEASDIFHNFADVIGGDARFIQTGRALFFGERDADAAHANVEMNRELGVEIQTLAPSELARIVPQANLDGIALGVYEPNSGYADPMATTYAYADQARNRGAEIVTGCAVTGINISGGRVTGVETEQGPIDADAIVAAIGPWVNKLAAPLGEFLPVTPIRVQMVHLRRPPSLESLGVNVIDYTTGAYFRVDAGHSTLVGGEEWDDLSEVVNPDAFGLNADHDTITRFWDRARLRFPGFDAATQRGGYGSLYDMTPDGNPILDRSPSVEGLYWATGFSGHGFKLSPVVGRMVAEFVMHGESSDHPIREFRASRFDEGDLLEAEHPYEGRRHQ